LLDPSDEEIWKGRECTEEAFTEFGEIIARYPLLNIWSLFNEHSSVGLLPIPEFVTPNICRTRRRDIRYVIDTYRRLRDFGPPIARHAMREARAFWKRHS
jgi:hypothetical protein